MKKLTEKKRGFIMSTMRDWIKGLEFLDFITEKIAFFAGIVFMCLESAALLAVPALVKVYNNPTTLSPDTMGFSGSYWNILVVVGVASYILSVVISIIRVAVAFPDSNGRMDSLKSLFMDLLLLAAIVSVVMIAAPIAMSFNV